MDGKINACLLQLAQEADHYLLFFRTRVAAEEQYADVLFKTAAKVEDGLKDTHRGSAPSTLRTAWVETVKDTRQTAEAHRMAASMCRQRIIEPLQFIKETFERTRRRCKDELKSSCNEYADYKQSVGHFQRAYIRHCSDLAALQHAETSPTASSETADFNSLAATSRTSSPPPEPKPVELVSGVTASLQRDLQSHPVAPSNVAARATEAFKKSSQQLTSIVNKLGGDNQRHEILNNGPQSQLTPISTHAQSHVGKLIKAKREAEQADNDYRRSIYHLETLRLQKERVHRASRQSALDFVVELGRGVDAAIYNYCDVMQSTQAVCTSMFAHTADVAKSIQADLDALEYSAKLPLDGSLDGPVYYENMFVGRCKSLVFGMPLDTYSSTFSPPKHVPQIVELCIGTVEQKILEAPAEGLYRISPSAKVVQKLVLDVEKDENAFYFTENTDINAVAAILKLYLRRLPFPLCAMPVSERTSLSPALFSQDEQERTAALGHLAKRMKRLSGSHQATLAAVVRHLARIAEFEASTKMSISSLSLIFTPCIFETEDTIIIDRDAAKDRILEALIKNNDIFEREPVELPPRSESLHPRPTAEEEFPMRVTSPVGHLVQPQRRSFSVKKKPVGSSETSSPVAAELHSRPTTPGGPVRSTSDDVYALYSTYAEMDASQQQSIPPVSLLYTNPPARSLPPGAGSQH